MRIPDPLSRPLVAVKKTIRVRGGFTLEVSQDHIAVLTWKDGTYSILGPGLHELKNTGLMPAEACWIKVGPLGREDGSPMRYALSITDSRTKDGCCVGLFCQLEVMIWEPRSFLSSLMTGRESMSPRELEEAIRGHVKEGLAEAVADQDSGDISKPSFELRLKHYVNLSLRGLGLRVGLLRLEVLKSIGPVRTADELARILEERLPFPLDERRAADFERKLRLVSERPWLIAKPLDENWASEWKAFWVEVAQDLMWKQGRFLLSLQDLASLTPFSSMRTDWREELFETLKEKIGSLGDYVFSREVLDALSSALARWARDVGLFEISTEGLVSLLGLSEQEARMLLDHMAGRGACEWVEKGKSVLLSPSSL
ncbi:hypothetical protein B6U66_05545 [Candidatus Bathyarchaeota archaeon ex4484_135]|nr:MAG: hypothetical protein B6U66_05545 [Candidatus Bathyarchaeota archaeon ex4484_135]